MKRSLRLRRSSLSYLLCCSLVVLALWKCCNVAFVNAPSSASPRHVSITRQARGGGLREWLKGKFGKGSTTEAPTPAPEPAAESAPAPAPPPAKESAPEKAPEPAPPDRDAAFETAFNHFDLDGNGKIDKEELQKAAEELGETQEQISALMAKFDLNSDGGIDLPEFKKMVLEIEETCGTTSESCFVLEDSSTWGNLFTYDPKQWEKLSKRGSVVADLKSR